VIRPGSLVREANVPPEPDLRATEREAR